MEGGKRHGAGFYGGLGKRWALYHGMALGVLNKVVCVGLGTEYSGEICFWIVRGNVTVASVCYSLLVMTGVKVLGQVRAMIVRFNPGTQH